MVTDVVAVGVVFGAVESEPPHAAAATHMRTSQRICTVTSPRSGLGIFVPHIRRADESFRISRPSEAGSSEIFGTIHPRGGYAGRRSRSSPPRSGDWALL